MWFVRIASKNRWTSLVNYIWQSVSNSPCKCEHNGELHSWVRWNVKLLLSPASSCLYNVQCTMYRCKCPASSCCLNMPRLTLVSWSWQGWHCSKPSLAQECETSSHASAPACIQLPVHNKVDTSLAIISQVSSAQDKYFHWQWQSVNLHAAA